MAIVELTHPAARLSIFEGFDAVTLSAGALEATFVPEAGMVGASLLHRGEELVDRRAGLREYRATGAVMGIPLLHPWANRLSADEYELHGRHVHLDGDAPRDDGGLPIHGLLGGRARWTVDSVDVDARGAHLQASRGFQHPSFPFPHAVTVSVVLEAQRLTMSTRITPTGGPPVPLSFGFHPYLRLPGIDRAEWDVTLPPRCHAALDARGLPTPHVVAEPAQRLRLGDLGFDDAYVGIADGAAFGVHGGGRSLTVTHHAGFPVAQVYSPSGAQFICFEPMTAPIDALRTGIGLRRAIPGHPFTASFSIAVE